MTPEGEAAVAEALAQREPNDVEINEARVFGDDRLVRVIIKIRTKIAEENAKWEAAIEDLKKQKLMVETEVLRRLQERGATSTKTEHGTSFVTEEATYTIADEEAYGRFVLEMQEPSFYQKRAKVETVTAWMKNNGGMLPPGLSVFRKLVVNTRIPKRKAQPMESNDGQSTQED